MSVFLGAFESSHGGSDEFLSRAELKKCGSAMGLIN